LVKGGGGQIEKLFGRKGDGEGRILQDANYSVIVGDVRAGGHESRSMSGVGGRFRGSNNWGKEKGQKKAVAAPVGDMNLRRVWNQSSSI